MKGEAMKLWLKSPPVQAIGARIMGRYLLFAARTIRWRIQDDGAIAMLAAQKPVILAFWHETLPAMPILLLRARKAGYANPGHILVSRHRDGQFVAKAMRRLGLLPVAGSTSRGGAAGLRALARALRSGASVGLTPDGPRGPRQVAASGTAQLAALTGAPVIACAAWTRPAIQLSSWDRMRIPLPFTRGALICRPPVGVARQAAGLMRPVIEAELRAAFQQAAQ
jgi:lysophospholipid acyltransferase (LPLAT)-like uncharacterized protein